MNLFWQHCEGYFSLMIPRDIVASATLCVHTFALIIHYGYLHVPDLNSGGPMTITSGIFCLFYFGERHESFVKKMSQLLRYLKA